MQYAKLGNTGVTVSRICLGCMSYGDGKWREWTIGGDEAREHFAAAIDAGVNFFDTADVYSIGVSEEITGRWLAEMAYARRYRGRDQGQRSDGQGAESPRAQPQAHYRGMRQFVAPAAAPTISTSTRSIAGTFRRRSKRPSTRWIARACRKSPLPRRQQHGGVAILQGALRPRNMAGIASWRCRITTI